MDVSRLVLDGCMLGPATPATLNRMLELFGF